MAQHKRKPPGRLGRLSDCDVRADGFDTPDIKRRVHPYKPRGLRPIGAIVADVTRQPRPDEIEVLRAIWWRQRRSGHTMPAEPGVILISGGGP